MGVKWTKEQQQAIYEKGQNILVAAAAGSGKTAVLVERIINKIVNDGVDIDTLLVVTFTNAAASEMRERVLEAIYSKLEENPDDENLQKQITLLNKSSICTIDSFCLEVVKNNFFELDNISPNFKIGDKIEIDLLKQEIIEEIFEEKYEKNDQDFQKLLTTYTSYKDDAPLKDLILKVYTYIQSDPFPEKWLKEKIELFNLEEKIEADFSTTIWGENLLSDLEEELVDYIKILQKVEKELAFDPELDKFQQTITDDIRKLMSVKETIDNWDNTVEKLNNFVFATWPRKKIESDLKEYAKTARDNIKDKLKASTKKIFTTGSKQANQDILDMYEILKKLEAMVVEFKAKFSTKKRQRNMVDFHDVEHFALKLLIRLDEETGEIIYTDIAKRYQEKFSEIAIDEYQDSNLVQEYILTSVSKKNNIFMVGDVKQSIYKFRQAMPELFLDKYHTYMKKENLTEKDNLKIQLFKNFRSKKNVLDFTNVIFQNIMSNVLGDIDYVEEEYLNLGANYEMIDQNQDIEIDILNISSSDNEKIEQGIQDEEDSKNFNIESNTEFERLENIEIEAKYVANRIKEFIDTKYQVWDKRKNCYRDIKYKDIVILLRATSLPAPVFEQELIKAGIPVFSDSSQVYLESIEIETIISLLKVIDNPMQDIPLVAVLRSNIGNFTDNDLMEIRLVDRYSNFYTCMKKASEEVTGSVGKKVTEFLNNLEMWRNEQEYLALDEFIWKIYSDTGYYNYVSLMPNGILRQANLKMLFEKARKFESATFKGLYNFIRFLERLKKSSGDMEAAKIIGENEDVVRIMSIHKSKGLEFPLVFLSNTAKQFNFMDLTDNIVLHQKMGLGVKYIDYDMSIQYDTVTKAAIKNQVKVETISEEMRVLYVALTRAKEKLIVTGIVKDYHKKMEKLEAQKEIYDKEHDKINPIFTKKFKSYLDWIILVYMYDKNIMDEYTRYNIYDVNEIKKEFKADVKKEDCNLIEEMDKVHIDKNILSEIAKTVNKKYANILATTIPTKSSVTKLKELANEKSIEKRINKDIHNKSNENNTEIKEETNIKNYKNIFNMPDFIKNSKNEKLSGAQKGTLIHLCMQKLDVKIQYNKSVLENMINDLVWKNILTEKEAENIDIEKILSFTKSDLWNDMKLAKKIYQEKPFYINVPAREIYEEEVEEEILVQGIIDLYYIDKNDNIVLVDYKTDYIPSGKEEEFIKKYKVQLDFYEKALEEALDKKVFKKVIYSTYLNKELILVD